VLTKEKLKLLHEGGRRPTFMEGDVDQVWEILLKTMNMSETARHFGCCRDTIRKFIKKHPYQHPETEKPPNKKHFRIF
jgi:predicted Zn-dependent peptidase